MGWSTRWATPDDLEVVLGLLPRLADFDLPARRAAEMFWNDDAQLLRSWAEGGAEQTIVRVGVDHLDDVAVAAAVVTFGRDMFSGEPSAHLEVIVVAPAVDGAGMGRQLIGEMEAEALARGATVMSLHVVGNNARARHVYRQLGYAEELIRAVKHLGR